MESTGKAAVQSITQWSALLTLFFWALPFILRQVGIKSPDDMAMLVQAAHQLAVPIGTIFVVWGRMRAKTPITSILPQPGVEYPPT